MLQRIFQGFELARVKIFPIKDLWMFIIAVVLISMTSAAIGSFVAGIKPTEFFLGGNEDVLVITPPGVATPMTGSIPISLVHDVGQLEGVETVSSEVLGVVVAQNLNDRAIIIRGITSEFLNITPPLNMKGKWFNQLSKKKDNFTTTFGAVIGTSLAKDQKLDIGSKLTLVSTLTPMTIELTIEGIITTGTPIDTELIVPLATAQAMTGRLPDAVSFIRVKIYSTRLTKAQLAETVNGKYQVPVKVQSNDPVFEDDLNGEPLMVFSLAGELIKTQRLDSNGRTTFELPFGTYRFVAAPSFTEQNKPVDVFVNQSTSEPINLWIGKKRRELIVNVTYNNQPAINATVIIQEKFHPTKIYNDSTPSNGVISFFNLTDSYYEVDIYYKGLSEKKQVLLNCTKEVRVALTNSLRLTVLNATTEEEIMGGTIQLFNVSNPLQVIFPQDTSNNNQTMIPYDSGTVLYIDEPNTYLANYSIGNRWRTWKQTVFGNTSMIIYLGKGELMVTVFDFKGEVLEKSNVSVFLDGEIMDYKETNEEGRARFELETGKYYEILAKYTQTSKNESSTIYFESSKEISISFESIDVYWLEIRVYNGTTESQESSGLAYTNLTLFNNTGIINSTKTNEDGTARIPLDHPGNYILNTTYHEYSWHQEINIFKETIQVNIPLGDVKLKIITRTSSNFPIANSSVKIFREEELVEEIVTNDNGEITVKVPLGDYTIIIEKLRFKEELLLSFKESQIYTIEKIFDLIGTLILRGTDSGGKGLVGAALTLENVLYDITVSGITNQQAEIAFNDLPWGNYSLKVVVQGVLYEGLLIGFAEEKDKLTIKLTLPIGQLDKEISLLKWRGEKNFGVEESKEFLSGFLVTTLEVITTALIALVIVTTSLLLLSVSSVISHPITINQRNILMIRTLGGSDKQIYFCIAIQMTINGFIASVVGVGIGTIIMVNTNLFQTTNIGGLIIIPVVSLEIILGIVISTVLVILTKIWYILNSEFHPQRSIQKSIQTHY